MTYPGNSVSFGYFDAPGDFELSQIWYKTGSGTTISKFDYTYDALRRIKTWTMQADNGTPQVLAPEYDNEDQLLGATLTQSGAPTKAYGYGYDDAGNRTGEQIETFTPTRALSVTGTGYNTVNQLGSRSGAGPAPVRFRGTINEPGTVKVNGQSAKMTQDPASPSNGKIFTTTLSLPLGNNDVTVVATDLSTRQTPPPPGPNSSTKSYRVSVAAGSSKSFGYDANGNCTLAGSTTYGWDGEDRLIGITNGVLTTEFSYDGFGRRVSIIERNNGTVTSTKKFVWCGMDPAEELDANNTVTSKGSSLYFDPVVLHLY